MSLDLEGLFRLNVSGLELFVRTSLVYLGLIVAMRALGRREMGAFEIPDLLMVVLIADGVQNGMAADYDSVTGALIVGGTLIGWNYVLDMLTGRSAFVRKLVRPAELKLVENGRLLRRNMRREFISEDELMSQLRMQGINDVGEVKVACLEPGGELSVIKRDTSAEEQDQSGSQRRRTPIS